MFQRLKAVVALALVICILLPATTSALQYAPNSPRKDVLAGHPEPPIKASTSRSTNSAYATSNALFVFSWGRGLVVINRTFSFLFLWN